MALEVNEKEIRDLVMSRREALEFCVDRYTPTGKERANPVYLATISNDYLRKTREIRGQSEYDLELKAKEQFSQWKVLEIKARISEAKRRATGDAEKLCEEQSREAREVIESLRSILKSSHAAAKPLDFRTYLDRGEFPAFSFGTPQPTAPPQVLHPAAPKRSVLHYLVPSLWRKRMVEHEAAQELARGTMESRLKQHRLAEERWYAARAEAIKEHEQKKREFLTKQAQHNREIERFIGEYKGGNPEAVHEYLVEVFANLASPDAFPVEHRASLDPESSTAVIDIWVPSQPNVPDVIDYKFRKAARSSDPVRMKPKDHDELYDSAVKQAVLRTLRVAVASTEAGAIDGVVVNAWVTYLDKATGSDKSSCIVSVSADRAKLSAINWDRVDPTVCIKSLKGLLAGPLSDIAPVQPILQLRTDDRRFVESHEVLAEMNATTNLAEIGWEEFEHLVRELFGEMFSEQGAEVKVTQASSDGGVDAIAFDPDPIRGGKFVIQAKRYTKVVPVSAVRDLYGTMISEGASKGLLVTTAHYGRDSREFVKDKPISLIDGANLVYLLEKYGHKVRIDVKAARANQSRDPHAR